GSVEIDGHDLATLPRQAIRAALAALLQETVTFPGTVLANLDPSGTSSAQKVEHVVQSAGIYDLIALSDVAFSPTWPICAYSQGQLQLLAIARAVLRKSRLLIFDDMSSSVDVATEQRTIGVIMREFAESTVIAVAHRLNTVAASDRIVVMDNGSIVEVRAPSELLVRSGGMFQSMGQPRFSPTW
ncbi:hypothetical protein CERZMDRAFT_46329, partial [Cercospora zeae-maydis SCOH1-5]